MKKHVLLATSLVLSSAISFGAGYQLNLQGLRQLAMGGSGTAVPWDMSTIFYNPAGMSQIDHVQAYGSVAFVMPRVKYVESPGTYVAETQAQTFTPFNLYVGGPTSYRSPVSIGVGVYTPFGSGIKWDDNWRGRYMIQNIELQTIFVQPTISYQVNDMISIGGGFIYAFGSMELNNALPITDENNNDGKAHLEGNGHGFGFNLGFHVMASEKVQFGITYRSQVNMNVKRGYATFTVPPSLSSQFLYTPFSASLPLPQVVSVGVGYHANDYLTLQADINYVGWGAYDSLVIDFDANSPSLMDLRSPRRYKNTVALRVGAHYVFNDNFSGMIGAMIDPSPVTEGFVTPDLPDANRFGATIGATYRITEGLTVLAAMEFGTTIKRVSSFDYAGFSGTYQTKAFIPAIGVSYDF